MTYDIACFEEAMEIYSLSFLPLICFQLLIGYPEKQGKTKAFLLRFIITSTFFLAQLSKIKIKYHDPM